MAGYYETKTEHAFKTFAGDLRAGDISPVIYMYGAEEYLIEWAVNTLAGKYVSPGAKSMDFERPDGESVTADDIINACETFSMISGETVPMRSRRRRLSSVRICSARITLSLTSPVPSQSMGTWVGMRALFNCPVTASTITVGL